MMGDKQKVFVGERFEEFTGVVVRRLQIGNEKKLKNFGMNSLNCWFYDVFVFFKSGSVNANLP